MFFYFEPAEFHVGQACKIVEVNHHTFSDRVGRNVIITKVMEEDRMVFAQEAKPIKYRVNRRGRTVTEFDPRCVETIYSFDELEAIPEHEAKKLLSSLSLSYHSIR